MFTRSLKDDIKLVHDSFLKGAALLYQEVLFWESPAITDAVTEEISSGMSIKQREQASKCFKSYRYVDESLSVLHGGDLLETLEQWSLVDQNIDRRSFLQMKENFAKLNYYGIYHPFLSVAISLKLNCPCHVMGNEYVHLEPIFSQSATEQTSCPSPIEVSLPSLEELSWEQIFDLRASPFIDRYRLFMSSYQNKGSDTENLTAQINEALWSMVGIYKPSPSGQTIKRIVANIPIPVIPVPNPYAVYRDVKDGWRERQIFVQYGWLLFIHEAREKAHKYRKSRLSNKPDSADDK